jgi:hypothetical protein
MKHAINHGQYEVYLTGSGKNVRRNVYEDETGREYIVWYNQIVEVERFGYKYFTKEAY